MLVPPPIKIVYVFASQAAAKYRVTYKLKFQKKGDWPLSFGQHTFFSSFIPKKLFCAFVMFTNFVFDHVTSPTRLSSSHTRTHTLGLLQPKIKFPIFFPKHYRCFFVCTSIVHPHPRYYYRTMFARRNQRTICKVKILNCYF